MPELLHQTVRLSAGSHPSPRSGMCAVELASLLAGEPFSDHPRSVCPVVAEFVRTYNDRLGADRRQDLVPYAARIVGTCGDRALERARAARCAAWALARMDRRREPRRLRRVAEGRAGRLRRTRELAARAAARSTHGVSDTSHAAALALLDELIALGRRADVTPDGPPVEAREPAPARQR
jgi:hypothetical protein